MRTKILLAVAASTVSLAGLGSGVALAAPSPNADCIAQINAAGGPPASTPGHSGLAAQGGVSAVAQNAHDACLANSAPTYAD